MYKIIFILTAFTLFLNSCKTSQFGQKVNEPFSGNKYESNARYFRAVGKGVSVKDNIAKSKADLDAKNVLAGQINTTIKNVSDQYLAQTENELRGEVADKFQQLVRQVMNTEVSDLRKFDEKKFYNGTDYTVFVAYEIHKKAMFRFIKKQAEAEKYSSDKQKQLIQEMIEQEMAKMED